MFLSITTTTIEAQHQWFLVRLKMWFAINVGSLGTTNVIVQVVKVVVVAMDFKEHRSPHVGCRYIACSFRMYKAFQAKGSHSDLYETQWHRF